MVEFMQITPTTMIIVEKIRVVACDQDYEGWEAYANTLTSKKIQEEIHTLRQNEKKKIEEGDEIMAAYYSDYAATLQTMLIRRRKYGDAV